MFDWRAHQIHPGARNGPNVLRCGKLRLPGQIFCISVSLISHRWRRSDVV
jgi:hypothetical protein